MDSAFMALANLRYINAINNNNNNNTRARPDSSSRVISEWSSARRRRRLIALACCWPWNQARLDQARHDNFDFSKFTRRRRHFFAVSSGSRSRQRRKDLAPDVSARLSVSRHPCTYATVDSSHYSYLPVPTHLSDRQIPSSTQNYKLEGTR